MGIKPLTALLSLWLLASGSFAESLLNADRARNVTSLFFGNNADPWDDPSRGPYAPSSPGDPDLGEQRLLEPLDGYQEFNFLLAERAIWTSNAGLTDTGELSDFYSDTEVRLSYNPQLAANTFGEFSAGYSFYRYADHSALDFDSLETTLGLIHAFRDLNDLSIWLRYNYLRLLSGRGHDELFTDHTIEIGVYYPISLGPRHFAYGAYTSEFSLDGNPGYASRNEHGVTLGYRFAFTDRTQLESYYRIYVHDYLERGRDDLLQTAGLALTTHLTDRLDLVLSASYTINDSDLPGADYEVGDAGAILSLNIEF